MNPDEFRRLYVCHFALSHGTDPRAQTLVILGQLGVATFSLEYALFAMGKL